MSIADTLVGFASSLRARLNSINTSLAGKGQTSAGSLAEVPAKIDAISTGVDVSGVTAIEDDVIAGKKFVDSTGALKDGSMPENTAETVTLSSSKTVYSIPHGKHSGSGKVKIDIDTDNNTFTPTKSSQTKNAPSGKVWTSVNINAADIPEYETWTLTMSSGSTVTKTVGVSTL